MTRRVSMGLLAAGVAAAAAVASPAHAGGPIYFHKADVDRAAFGADLAECVELAGGVRAPPRNSVYTPNLYAVAVVAFLDGFMGARERRKMIDNVLRTCMADKGYRRVRAPDAVVDGLSGLKQDARIDRLFELAAAREPQGKVLPQ
jgi:hypothetical protein